MSVPFLTQRGVIDIAALQPADMSAEVIGDTLAKINRFNGRTPEPWSVASHSVLVMHLVQPEHMAWALLHDAHEFILGDWITPAVEFLCASGTRSSVENAITNAKGRLDRTIAAAWECACLSKTLAIRRADHIAYQAECIEFFGMSAGTRSAEDAEDIERALFLISELPRGGAWRQARDLWIHHARALARSGHLRLPAGAIMPGEDPALT